MKEVHFHRLAASENSLHSYWDFNLSPIFFSVLYLPNYQSIGSIWLKVLKVACLIFTATPLPPETLTWPRF